MRDEFSALRSRAKGAAADGGVVLPGPHRSGCPARLPCVLRKLGFNRKWQFLHNPCYISKLNRTNVSLTKL